MTKKIKKQTSKKAIIYRIVIDNHLCPYGLKALDLLKSKNYEVEDIHLKTRKEIEAFKQKHNIKTTPQIFIGSKRIGGYDELVLFLNKSNSKNKITYRPITNLFILTFLMAATTSWNLFEAFAPLEIFEYFMSYSICMLAALKLKDIESFSINFLNYDLVAQKWVRYSYLYPYLEATSGIGMLAMNSLSFISAPISLMIGILGAISVIKAVYIDKRDLKCACVGGESKVPLGFISLSENLMMIVMGIWMLYKI